MVPLAPTRRSRSPWSLCIYLSRPALGSLWCRADWRGAATTRIARAGLERSRDQALVLSFPFSPVFDAGPVNHSIACPPHRVTTPLCSRGARSRTRVAVSRLHIASDSVEELALPPQLNGTRVRDPRSTAPTAADPSARANPPPRLPARPTTNSAPARPPDPRTNAAICGTRGLGMRFGAIARRLARTTSEHAKIGSRITGAWTVIDCDASARPSLVRDAN